jgi:hypothetical protein
LPDAPMPPPRAQTSRSKQNGRYLRGSPRRGGIRRDLAASAFCCRGGQRRASTLVARAPPYASNTRRISSRTRPRHRDPSQLPPRPGGMGRIKSQDPNDTGLPAPETQTLTSGPALPQTVITVSTGCSRNSPQMLRAMPGNIIDRCHPASFDRQGCT